MLQEEEGGHWPQNTIDWKSEYREEAAHPTPELSEAGPAHCPPGPITTATVAPLAVVQELQGRKPQERIKASHQHPEHWLLL